MDCPSDTESDLSCSGSPKAQRNILLTQVSISGIEKDEFPLQAVQRAIQKFREREAADILQDSSYLLAVQESSELVLQFLNRIPNLLGTRQNSQALRLFAELGKSSYHQLLLNFRKYLRIAAYQECAASKATMLVTWTDILIAKISSLAIPIAAGSVAYASANQKEPGWLQLRREEDVVRAATQLPDNWAAIVTVIGSNTFSPAARRLAASLAFIAYVMVPQITSKRTRTDNSPLLDVLQASYIAINQASCIDSPSVSHTFLDKVQIAMLISLFANVYLQIVNLGDMTRVSQLRPEGFGHILGSIQSIMGRSEAFFVLEELDPPQCILLRWGNVVPWSWSTWNDPRIANTETIRSLSATWLYLMDAPVYGLQYDPLHRKVFGIDLNCVLLDDLFSSSLVILLLQDVGKNKCLPCHVTSNVLTKLCWAVVQYMEAHALSPESHFEARMSEFCKSLLLLFPITEPYQEGGNVDSLCTRRHAVTVPAKSFIVEALALSPSDIITAAVQNICQDRETQFVVNLEGAMRSCLTALSDRRTGDDDSRNKTTKIARSLLDCLSLLLLRSTIDHPILRGCLSSFLIQVAQLLLSNVHDSSLCVVLLDSFLMTLAACRKRKFTLKIGDESVWLLSMGIHGPRLRTAAAFGFFLLSTAEHRRECLLKHEAFNYLLVVLTRIVEKQCPEEEEPLALLVSPNLCYALNSIVLASTELTRKYLLSSPWTLTVRLSLQELLADQVPTDPYFKVLRERLIKAGTDLLNVLFANVEDLSTSPSVYHSQKNKLQVKDNRLQHSPRLVYYRDHSESGLVPVYDSEQ